MYQTQHLQPFPPVPQQPEDVAASCGRYVAEFTANGYTIIPGGHDAAWVQAARARYPLMRERQLGHGGEKPAAFDNLLELEPELFLQAITRERIWAVAERIIGPHVQIESMTFAGCPVVERPLPPSVGDVPGWHRDLFATFPQDGSYQRPLLFNAMTYLQDLTDTVGPLCVIPGSHRRAVVIAPQTKQRHHPQAVRLYPRAGDVVVFHHALLHSGSYNLSDETRYFFCVAYNHCWLKHRANYGGPACQHIINQAREGGDRRLLRLLGADEHVLTRALYHHVLAPEEAVWSQWSDEDRTALPGAAYVPVLR